MPLARNPSVILRTKRLREALVARPTHFVRTEEPVQAAVLVVLIARNEWVQPRQMGVPTAVVHALSLSLSHWSRVRPVYERVITPAARSRPLANDRKTATVYTLPVKKQLR